METTTKVLDIQAKHEVKDYPYGRLRTSAFFSIEFIEGKGFRSVFQTINPKTGKLNAEKKGTYYTFLCNKLDESNGHINTHGWSIYGLARNISILTLAFGLARFAAKRTRPTL